MASGNMEFGNNGVWNDAGPDQTTLRSTNANGTLSVENLATGAGLIVRGIRRGVEVSTLGAPPMGPPPPEVAVSGEGFIGVRGAGGFNGTGGAASSGVQGVNLGSGNGVTGDSPQRNGVQGTSSSQSASGVYGENLSGGGFGVAGRSNVPFGSPLPIGAAVLGDNTAGGMAGLFQGRVLVTGLLTKSGGGFQIDHPLDPANRYLCHSFVESPDMLNVYNGNITTDAGGNATVELPDYFEALNRDFRYQLTVVGQFAQAMVAEEVRDNHFSIKTEKPNVKVSWQVTGIRQDAWANAQQTEADVAKPEGERGKYLAPLEHGQAATAGIYHSKSLAEDLVADQPRK